MYVQIRQVADATASRVRRDPSVRIFLFVVWGSTLALQLAALLFGLEPSYPRSFRWGRGVAPTWCGGRLLEQRTQALACRDAILRLCPVLTCIDDEYPVGSHSTAGKA